MLKQPHRQTGFDCSVCGAQNQLAPFKCAKGGKLDDTIEDAYFHAGDYIWDGYCDVAENYVRIFICESQVDPANTAPHVQDWADRHQLKVTIEWQTRKQNGNWRDVVVLLDDESPENSRILGQIYSQCIKRLKQLTENENV